jgi:hypothetical protein
VRSAGALSAQNSQLMLKTSLSSSAARLRKRKTKIETAAKRIVTMTVTVWLTRENHQPLSALWRF